MICLKLPFVSGNCFKYPNIRQIKITMLLFHLYSMFFFHSLNSRYLLFSTSVDSYDENVSIRSFGYDAMWGSIGGYVGMVLGISFFQLPDIIYCGLQFFRNLRRIVHKKQYSK